MRRLHQLLLLLVVTLLCVKLFFQVWFPHHWQRPLSVVIYPINADGQWSTGQYIAALEHEHFAAIERFISQQAEHYGMGLETPVAVRLGSELEAHPPAPPAAGSHADYLHWSVRIRLWSWWHLPADDGDIRIFMRFFSPHHHPQLAHSIGLKQGRIGVVNGYAAIDLQPRNNFVAAHELLHTLGASDKYDLTTQLPLFPHGYAEPQRQPRWPQQRAEIMGGWIPLASGHAVMPESLEQALIGENTAQEIGWR